MPIAADIDEILSRPRLLFFGGSFDPVHHGHTMLAPAAARRRWGDQGGWGVVFVPAGRSPHKQTEPTPDGHRLAMLEIAIGGEPDSAIWDHELARGDGPSYWAETWAVVRTRFAHAECRFLIGADQARAMHSWSSYRAFWRDALVVLRGEDDSAPDLLKAIHATHAWSIADMEDWDSMIVRTDMHAASSTGIRDLLKDSARRKTRIEGLDPGVQDYILANGLYHA